MAQILDLGNAISPRGAKGEQGDTGATGTRGPAGVDSKTPTFSINASGYLIATYEN